MFPALAAPTNTISTPIPSPLMGAYQSACMPISKSGGRLFSLTSVLVEQSELLVVTGIHNDSSCSPQSRHLSIRLAASYVLTSIVSTTPYVSYLSSFGRIYETMTVYVAGNLLSELNANCSLSGGRSWRVNEMVDVLNLQCSVLDLNPRRDAFGGRASVGVSTSGSLIVEPMSSSGSEAMEVWISFLCSSSLFFFFFSHSLFFSFYSFFSLILSFSLCFFSSLSPSPSFSGISFLFVFPPHPPLFFPLPFSKNLFLSLFRGISWIMK